MRRYTPVAPTLAFTGLRFQDRRDLPDPTLGTHRAKPIEQTPAGTFAVRVQQCGPDIVLQPAAEVMPAGENREDQPPSR
jgi:hypothetical protein